jgi:hypothetical protein
MRRQGWIATLAMLAAIPAAAQTSFPDLHGTWRGDSESIISDSGNPHHPGPSQSEPRLTSVPFTLTIDKQDGRRFSGTFSSPRDAESVIGVITRASNLLFVDTDGYASGTLLGPDRTGWRPAISRSPHMLGWTGPPTASNVPGCDVSQRSQGEPSE